MHMYLSIPCAYNIYNISVYINNYLSLHIHIYTYITKWDSTTTMDYLFYEVPTAKKRIKQGGILQ